MEGRPSPVTSPPFTAPHSAPVPSPTSTSTGTPAAACAAAPIAVEASASVEATERSIAPAMIRKAMAKAIVAFSLKLNVASEWFHSDRTSGEAIASKTKTAAATASRRTSHRPTRAARLAAVGDRRDQDRRARDRELPERRDAHHRERVLHDPQEQRGQHRARHRADPPRDGDPTDHAGGHEFELEPAGDADIGDRVARHPEIARDPRQRARNHEGRASRAAHVDPGMDRRRGIAPAA